jgi:hypothetical protein
LGGWRQALGRLALGFAANAFPLNVEWGRTDRSTSRRVGLCACGCVCVHVCVWMRVWAVGEVSSLTLLMSSYICMHFGVVWSARGVRRLYVCIFVCRVA